MNKYFKFLKSFAKPCTARDSQYMNTQKSLLHPLILMALYDHGESSVYDLGEHILGERGKSRANIRKALDNLMDDGLVKTKHYPHRQNSGTSMFYLPTAKGKNRVAALYKLA